MSVSAPTLVVSTQHMSVTTQPRRPDLSLVSDHSRLELLSAGRPQALETHEVAFGAPKTVDALGQTSGREPRPAAAPRTLAMSIVGVLYLYRLVIGYRSRG